jgi:hypothetical protein
MATTRVCNETTVAPETHARLRAIAERAGMTLGELLRGLGRGDGADGRRGRIGPRQLPILKGSAGTVDFWA